MTLEDLGRRAVACEHWRWMEGMQVEPLRFRVVWLTEDMIGESDQTSYFWKNVPDIFPDLSDPATCGAMLALVREATREPGFSVRMVAGYWYPDGEGLAVRAYESEAECLVAALEAAP